jgi:hypothetical protein
MEAILSARGMKAAEHAVAYDGRRALATEALAVRWCIPPNRVRVVKTGDGTTRRSSAGGQTIPNMEE